MFNQLLCVTFSNNFYNKFLSHKLDIAWFSNFDAILSWETVDSKILIESEEMGAIPF